jgi:Short C-terminal domain
MTGRGIVTGRECRRTPSRGLCAWNPQPAALDLIANSRGRRFRRAADRLRGGPDAPGGAGWDASRIPTLSRGPGDRGGERLTPLAALALEQRVLPARQLWEMYRPEQEVRESAQAQTEDIPSQIRELCTLRDEGLISDEEFEAKKRVFLDRI